MILSRSFLKHEIILLKLHITLFLMEQPAKFLFLSVVDLRMNQII